MREDLKEALKNASHSPKMDKRFAKDYAPAESIENILNPNELVIAAMYCLWRGSTVAILTDTRFLLVGAQGPTRSEPVAYDSIDYEMLSGVKGLKNLMFGYSLSFLEKSSLKNQHLRFCDPEGFTFHNLLLDLIQQASKSPQGTLGNQTSSNSDSPLEKIKGLKELLDMGAISQEEFEIKKQTLLENL